MSSTKQTILDDTNATPETSEIKIDEVVSGTNHLVAMKLQIQQHIDEYMVKPGHCKPGEVTAVITKDNNGNEVVGMLCNSDRKLDEILKAAFPEQYAERERNAKLNKEFNDKVKCLHRDDKPLNRAERRRMTKRWN